MPDNSLQQRPARNCYKPLGKENWNCSISQIWRDSLWILVTGLQYAVFLQSRKCFSGTWEQTWPTYSTCAWNSQASLSYTFSFPPNCCSYSSKGKKKLWGKISPQALNPAALVLHRHTSDSPFYLCTLPLSTTALISVHVFSWSFLTTLPLPFPCPVLIVAYKSSKLFHAREIPD